MILIFIILIVLAICRLQAWVYEKMCFKGLSVDMLFKEAGVFEGERTELLERVTNKKWLFLWSLTIRYKLSRNIKFDIREEEEQNKEAKGIDNYRRDLFSMGAYQKTTRHYGITLLKRGYYTIDDVTLTVNDLLLKYNFIAERKADAHVYVYPALVSFDAFNVPFEKIMGEILKKKNYIEDSFYIRGIRDYSPFDSLKKINWSATARSGEIKVNEFDFTTSQEIVLLLNIEKFNSWDGEGTLEESIRLTSTIATECLNGGMAVKIITNGCSSLTGESIKIESIGSGNYLESIYEQLACIDINNIDKAFSKTLADEFAVLDKSNLFILISQYFGEDLRAQLEITRLKGFNILWIIPKNIDTKLSFEVNEDTVVWEVMEK